MELGVTMFATDQSISPVELAVESEARGFGALWLPEHTHIPVSRATPWPVSVGGELPLKYKRSLDIVTSLGACAQATTTIRLGSGIALAAQHDPISYAKAWATLDVLSNGRAVFGVGYGWNREEMADHGVDYRTRRAHVREHVMAMQALWRDDEASFAGEFVAFEPAWAWPKPVQQPRIPTCIGGGAGPKMFAAIADYADGWLPIGGAGISAALPQLHEAWATAGRTGSPKVIPFGVHPTAGKLEYYAELGCEEAVLDIESMPRDEVLRILDGYAEFVDQLRS